MNWGGAAWAYWEIPPEAGAELVAPTEEVLEAYEQPYDASVPVLEGRYADCAKVIVACDHLNTHAQGAFYEALESERARALVRRIEFCYAPKH